MKGIIIFYKEENKYILKQLLEYINTSAKGLTYSVDGTLVENDIVLLKDNNMNDYNLRQFSKTNDSLVIGLLSGLPSDVCFYEKGDAYGIGRLDKHLEELSS